MVEPTLDQKLSLDSSGERKVTAAAGILEVLNQETDAVRAQLLTLRQDLARLQREISAPSAAQLLEANEQLVLAALRAQAIADAATRRLRELAPSGPARPRLSALRQRDRVEYRTRVENLRDTNEQLLLAALRSRELEAQAEQSHGRQIAFLAMAVHELRHPLLPLRLAAQRLPRARTEAELTALQETINSQVAHMARLIGDLLDGSRISTGKLRLQRQIVDLSSILDLAVQACQPAIEARHHSFQRCGMPGPLWVDGDALRLAQVFSNLLQNAAKYTPEGGEITMATALAGNVVTLTVSDNGIGITAQALPHVFDLFVQDEHATAHEQDGLGIGLAVVSELVEAHGGSVVASSAGKGLGSEFVVTLPLARRDA
jgi:signal transduction histidine kinase